MNTQITEKIEWEPTPKQQEFIQIPFSVDEALYGGAAGGGKTELGLWLPIVYGFHNYPAFKGILFRKTFPQLDKSIVPRAKLIYERLFRARYNDQKHIFTFPSGATIFCSYLETDDHARDHDTNEYNYAFFDELTHFSEFSYLYIAGSRVRSSTNLPAFTRAASNPGNEGHLWVRERFVTPAKDGNVLIQDESSGTCRIFISAKLTDNPYLTKNDPNYINRLHLLPYAEQRAKIHGDWWTFSGQVFDEFRTVKFPDEPENAIHVIKPFTIPEWWPKIVSIDWGYTHKTSVHWGAISPDSRVIIYREYVSQKERISSWTSKLLTRGQYDGNIVARVIDPSADQDRGQEKTIYQQVCEETGWRVEKATNDRISGKMLLHEFLRWKPRPPKYIPAEGFDLDRAEFIFRNYGLDARREYEEMFLPDPVEKNLPRLQIFDHCEELIKIIPILVYDDKHPEDVKKIGGDDPYDDIRYLLQRIDRYLIQVKKDSEERLKLESILQDYSESGNVTSFYRKMEKFEEFNKKNLGVRRHRSYKRSFGSVE